jgi:hypothetical protein
VVDTDLPHAKNDRLPSEVKQVQAACGMADSIRIFLKNSQPLTDCNFAPCFNVGDPVTAAPTGLRIRARIL